MDRSNSKEPGASGRRAPGLKNTRTKFEHFWEKARDFLTEEMDTAIDDWQHGEIVYLAKAISVRDFREQVAQRCPTGTSVPSEERLRLQFWPKHLKPKYQFITLGD